jgi:hypothetical protein
MLKDLLNCENLNPNKQKYHLVFIPPAAALPPIRCEKWKEYREKEKFQEQRNEKNWSSKKTLCKIYLLDKIEKEKKAYAFYINYYIFLE